MNFSSEEIGCLVPQAFLFLFLNTNVQTVKPESENLNQKGKEQHCFVWKESRHLCSFIYMHLTQ